MIRHFTLFVLLSGLLAGPLLAQDSVLNRYIAEGISSNLVLKQKHLSLANAINAMQQARSFYIPSIDFQTQYTTADGGRSIDLPVGDLINPVYATLNQLTGQNQFPQIKNEQIHFLPRNYYDARLRVSVPILNATLRNNILIKEKQAEISELEIKVYLRELIKEIKVTYYNYQSLRQSADIHLASVELARESRRTNERLVEAGKGLHAYVLRSEAEVTQSEAQYRSASLRAKSLQRYFNALLNRPADSEIEIESNGAISIEMLIPEADAAGREELESLKEVIGLRERILRMNQQETLPALSGFADLGSQAEQLRFNKQSLYYLIGLQFNLPIFSGGRQKLKIEEARREVEIAQLQEQYIREQLSASVEKALNDLLAAQFELESAEKQLEMAATYSRLIHRGYESGVNTYLETVDARAQLNSAQILVAINRFKFLSAAAVLEREAASFPINNYLNP